MSPAPVSAVERMALVWEVSTNQDIQQILAELRGEVMNELAGPGSEGPPDNPPSRTGASGSWATSEGCADSRSSVDMEKLVVRAPGP